MRLISKNELLPRFTDLVGEAKRVDIAVAWAKKCDALDVLAEAADRGTQIRIALGLSMNGTAPAALEKLNEFAKLRIVSPRSGIFHPKFFSFRGKGWTICWVGSSNLTAGGFGGNTELVFEFEDIAQKGRDWFRPLWKGLDPDPEPVIAAYIESYTPPVPSPRPRFQGDEPEVEPLPDQATWEQLVEGLRTRDDYCLFHEYSWGVLGKTFSYLHTIDRGREIAGLDDWVHLESEECNVIMGRDASTGTWGLLGHFDHRNTMPAFSSADGDVREQIQELLGPVLEIPDYEIVPTNVALDTVQAIKDVPYFGPAAATRLVTLARPDCLVSVNSQSAKGLARLSRVAETEGRQPRVITNDLANDYARLLDWVYRQEWFNAPEPDDVLEREVWRCRAALLDAFVYPPINPHFD